MAKLRRAGTTTQTVQGWALPHMSKKGGLNSLYGKVEVGTIPHGEVGTAPYGKAEAGTHDMAKQRQAHTIWQTRVEGN